MNKYIRLTLLTLLVLLGILQFIRPARNLSNDNTKAITQALPVPAGVQTILQTSCYDCHSNKTDYPWYTEIQPVGLWLNGHVDEGKHHLNFSEFAGYNLRRQYHGLEEIGDMVKEGEMPLSSYTLIHRYAALSPEQQTELVNWTVAMQDTLRAHYPLDSLVRKR
ncbi:MAG: heme-binding domain-containing protein [Saprospiraceae bacterium]